MQIDPQSGKLFTDSGRFPKKLQTSQPVPIRAMAQALEKIPSPAPVASAILPTAIIPKFGIIKNRTSSLIFLVTLASVAVPQRVQAAVTVGNPVIFDSYTPPNKGGFSSGNQGLATELTVTADIRISGFSILNEMTQAGNMRFALLSYPNPSFIVLTAPRSIAKDVSGTATWKTSDPLDILLQAGHTYLFGYVHNVSLIDYNDFISESKNGIVSNTNLHLIAGYSNPTYDRLFNSGADGAVRLIGIPESSTWTLAIGFFLAGVFQRRRRCS